MKRIILMLFLVFTTPLLFAEETSVLDSASCVLNEYRLEIYFSEIGGKGTGPVRIPHYTLYVNDNAVSPTMNDIKLIVEGYEGSLMESYVWLFQDSNQQTVGIGLRGISKLTPGTYTDAAAGVSISVGGYTIDQDGVPCTVKIK